MKNYCRGDPPTFAGKLAVLGDITALIRHFTNVTLKEDEVRVDVKMSPKMLQISEKKCSKG